jgi:predicted ATPase/CYTH domain-containing protein
MYQKGWSAAYRKYHGTYGTSRTNPAKGAKRVNQQAAVYRIVLTGGPCGGKSTALAHITERMQGLGFDVFRVPEAATLLLGGGIRLADLNTGQRVAFQDRLIHVIIALEDSFATHARATGRPAIILCDRGVMDCSAYLPPEAWTALLDEHNWSVVGLRDRRYDAIIHLVTAAEGAEQFYTTANNAVRSETPEQARQLDERLKNAWVGHPRLCVIDNSTNFADKVTRVVAAVCRYVGAPAPRGVERKFLVRGSPGPGVFPVHSEVIDVELTHLLSPDGGESRLRRRGQQGSFTYTHTLRQPGPDGQIVAVEQAISGRDYVALLAQADPKRPVVRTSRRVFVWEGRYFQLDTFLEPHAGLELLEAEFDDARGPVTLPPFLDIEREVTRDRRFALDGLATPAKKRARSRRA